MGVGSLLCMTRKERGDAKVIKLMCAEKTGGFNLVN